jgi:hypothetical protein
MTTHFSKLERNAQSDYGHTFRKKNIKEINPFLIPTNIVSFEPSPVGTAKLEVPIQSQNQMLKR